MNSSEQMSLTRLLTELRKKKAVIFDFDGVLADTGKIHEQAYREVLATLGITHFDYKSYAGMKTEDVMRHFASDEEKVKRMTQQKQERALALLQGVAPFPFATNLLALLKNKGIKIGLATSASRTRTTLMLENLGMQFDAIITGDDVAHAKPAPEIYEKVLAELGVTADEALVIEDSPAGIRAGKQAGIEVVGVVQTEKKEALQEADFIVQDVYSLYTLFTSAYYTLPSAGTSILNYNEKVVTIIPAAGKGTRLQFDKPKILYPIGDKTALEIMYEKVKGISKRVLIVANPEGAPLIKEECKRKDLPIEVITVFNSTGTGDSVRAASQDSLLTETILVIWGDQLGIEPTSLQKIISLHHAQKASLSLPTLLRKEPYIHLERDEEGNIIKVLRKRFNNTLPEYGENDAGVFVIQGTLLFSALETMLPLFKERKLTSSDGFDFLDIIPFLAGQGKKVVTASCIQEYETIGMNTLEEVQIHQARLFTTV